MYTYNAEITDLFGGDANYSWVRRYEIKAKNFRGAINKLARIYGSGWRLTTYCGNYQQYKMTGACITCFITEGE
jgi:hypothetical protein